MASFTSVTVPTQESLIIGQFVRIEWATDNADGVRIVHGFDKRNKRITTIDEPQGSHLLELMPVQSSGTMPRYFIELYALLNGAGFDKRRFDYELIANAISPLSLYRFVLLATNPDGSYIYSNQSPKAIVSLIEEVTEMYQAIQTLVQTSEDRQISIRTELGFNGTTTYPRQQHKLEVQALDTALEKLLAASTIIEQARVGGLQL
jgi:hypothetical protein